MTDPRAYHAQWYLANRERECTKNKAWYLKHCAEHMKRQRAYRRTAAGMLVSVRARAKVRGK